jgi:hypothetical protein
MNGLSLSLKCAWLNVRKKKKNVHGSIVNKILVLMNGHPCFHIHRSKIFHFRRRCWQRLTICAVVPQVEREIFSITSGAHYGRP